MAEGSGGGGGVVAASPPTSCTICHQVPEPVASRDVPRVCGACDSAKWTGAGFVHVRHLQKQELNYITHDAPRFRWWVSGDDAWRSRRAGEKVCCARVTFMLLFVAVRWRRWETPQLWE